MTQAISISMAEIYCFLAQSMRYPSFEWIRKNGLSGEQGRGHLYRCENRCDQEDGSGCHLEGPLQRHGPDRQGALSGLRRLRRCLSYSARYVNEEEGDPKADKCTFCVERVAAGLEPACVQTCLDRARIFGDLSDPNSEVAKHVKKGAAKLESAKVKIGPNVRYYGNKKDMHLLTTTCTPKTMPQANLRRIIMAHMLKPAMDQAKSLGMLGLAVR